MNKATCSVSKVPTGLSYYVRNGLSLAQFDSTHLAAFMASDSVISFEITSCAGHQLHKFNLIYGAVPYFRYAVYAPEPKIYASWKRKPLSQGEKIIPFQRNDASLIVFLPLHRVISLLLRNLKKARTPG